MLDRGRFLASFSSRFAATWATCFSARPCATGAAQTSATWKKSAGDWVEVDGVGARLRKKRGEVQPYDLGCDGCEPGEAALRQTGLRGAVQLRPVRFADQRGVYLPVSGVQVL